MIGKPILRVLGIDFDPELEVVTNGKNLIIFPLKPKEAESDLLVTLCWVSRNHGQTLEKLAH